MRKEKKITFIGYSMVNNFNFNFNGCFVFENTGSHRVLAHTPDLPPILSADDTISGRSFATFFRLLGTERVFCVESKFGPMLILCPAERKTVSVAIVLSPEASAKTELSTSFPIDAAIPYRFRNSVIESAKEAHELLFAADDIHSFYGDDPLSEVRIAKRISLFFNKLDIPCEIHIRAKEELPVFTRGESDIFFFFAALCIKLSHIGAKRTVYIQTTPTSNGYLLDLTVSSLSAEQNESLREFISSLLGSYLEFPFAFGCEGGVTKIRYYPLQTDESFFGLKRSGAKD